jgi:GAF domain-containing protein
VVLRELARLVSSGVPGCDGASISLLQGETASTLAASHEHIRTLDQAQETRDLGPCVTAMRDNTEITVQDYSAERRWPEVDGDLRDAGVRSSLSLPLSRDGRVVGGLNLYAEAPRSFGATSRAAAQAFARQAVVLLGYLQQLHAERAARAQERQISAALQRSLLPTLPV